MTDEEDTFKKTIIYKKFQKYKRKPFIYSKIALLIHRLRGPPSPLEKAHFGVSSLDRSEVLLNRSLRWE